MSLTKLGSYLRLEGFQGSFTFFIFPKQLNLFTLLETVNGVPCNGAAWKRWGSYSGPCPAEIGSQGRWEFKEGTALNSGSPPATWTEFMVSMNLNMALPCSGFSIGEGRRCWHPFRISPALWVSLTHPTNISSQSILTSMTRDASAAPAPCKSVRWIVHRRWWGEGAFCLFPSLKID